MKIHSSTRSGLTLIELSVTMGLVGVLGLIIYSLLNIGTILGAKNTATNTAHQQARVAMLEMIQDLHSSISLPALQGVIGTKAAGISFQQWGSVMVSGVMTPDGGPHKIISDALAGTTALPQKVIHIAVTPGQATPTVKQRLVVPTHQIEDDIVAVSGNSSDLSVTLANNLPVGIKGTASTGGDLVCYITDRCSYSVVQDPASAPGVYLLQWNKVSDVNSDGTPKFRNIVTDVTNPTPFSVPTTPAGALYYRFVAAIDLSTSDPNYTNRGYKSANILLNGQVPFKARLTTYQ